MVCSPANSRIATKGVVFHASASNQWHPRHHGIRQPVRRALHHEAPDERRNHGWQRPWHQHGGADQTPRARDPIEQDGQHQTQGQFHRHARHHEDRGVAERAPEAHVPQHLRVVGHADERTSEPRHPQIVQVQRFPERPQNRPEGDEHDDGQRGGRQHPCQSCLARRSRSGRPCHDRGPSFTRASSARIWPAASCSAGPGSSCRVSTRCSATCRIEES